METDRHSPEPFPIQLTLKEVPKMKTLNKAMTRFAQEEEGAQVVEYALIIAVVSIALVLALGSAGTGIASKFADFVDRVETCLSSGTC
jgi:pilus assembly protein Flp/PilA